MSTNIRRRSAAAKPPRRTDASRPAPPANVRRALLEWFAANARELPWRSRRDPYRVWVSEVMLQQTRVEAVVEPYARFLREFPTLAALARAEEADVLAAWSGLGYYRRARLLHAGAVYVARHHRGRVPAQRDVLLAVPGVGAYTAAAILSIAFGHREAALDANVTRVVARLLGIRDPHSATARRDVATYASALVDSESPGDVNEALMDLGSAICTARVARCGLCPLRKACVAAHSDDASSHAGSRPKAAPRSVALACAVVRDGDGVLLLRRPAGDALLGGMWDLPTVETDVDSRRMLEALVRERSGFVVSLGESEARVRHDIVGRRIVAAVYVAKTVRRPRRALPEDARVVAPAEQRGIALPALPVKILRALMPSAPKRSSATHAEA